MRNSTILIALITLAFTSCRKPKPVDIYVPQAKPRLVISSMALNEHAIILSAGYSIESMTKLEDSTNTGVPKELLLDSGIVQITETGGQPYTLERISSGVYGSRSLHIKPGVNYTLTVTDPAKQLSIGATTQYTPAPSVAESAVKFIPGTGKDSILKISIAINDASANGFYFVCYNTAREIRKNTHLSLNNSLNQNFNAINSFEPKNIQLIEGENAIDGIVRQSFSTEAYANDTMIVQIAQVDEGYFKYLSAYKRTGYLINQLTGEPINLPTNIRTGYGYFSLYSPVRYAFDLGKR